MSEIDTIDHALLSSVCGGARKAKDWCAALADETAGRATAFYDVFPKGRRDARYRYFRRINKAACESFNRQGQRAHQPDAPRD